MITASSASQSTADDSGGNTMSSWAPISDDRYLANTVGYAGGSPPRISAMCDR